MSNKANPVEDGQELGCGCVVHNAIRWIEDTITVNCQGVDYCPSHGGTK